MLFSPRQIISIYTSNGYWMLKLSSIRRLTFFDIFLISAQFTASRWHKAWFCYRKEATAEFITVQDHSFDSSSKSSHLWPWNRKATFVLLNYPAHWFKTAVCFFGPSAESAENQSKHVLIAKSACFCSFGNKALSQLYPKPQYLITSLKCLFW